MNYIKEGYELLEACFLHTQVPFIGILDINFFSLMLLFVGKFWKRPPNTAFNVHGPGSKFIRILLYIFAVVRQHHKVKLGFT